MASPDRSSAARDAARALRYPRSVVLADLGRSGADLLATGLPLALLELNPWVGGVLGGVLVLFAYFGLLTVIRAGTTIHFDAVCVEMRVEAPLRRRRWTPRRIEWSALDGVSLDYYSTDPKKDQGWMQLVMTSRGRKLKCDSRIQGFRRLAEHAVAQARQRGLPLSRSTSENYRALALGMLGPPGGRSQRNEKTSD